MPLLLKTCRMSILTVHPYDLRMAKNRPTKSIVGVAVPRGISLVCTPFYIYIFEAMSVLDVYISSLLAPRLCPQHLLFSGISALPAITALLLFFPTKRSLLSPRGG